MDTYTFATSRQLDYPVCVKINYLEGKQIPVNPSVLLKRPEIRHTGSIQNPFSEFYVTAQIWVESKPLNVPVQTPHVFFKNSRTWNKWLELPVQVKDCPITTQVAITLWDLSPLPADGNLDHAVPFGGTTIPLFDDDGVLRKGRQKCKVYRRRTADGQIPSDTPHISRPRRRRRGEAAPLIFPEEEELERLETLFKKHEMNEIPQNDWLDQLVFQKVGKLSRQVDESARKRASLRRAERKRIRNQRRESDAEQSMSETDANNTDLDEERFTLYVEFPRFDFPVVFEDYSYEPPKLMKDFLSTNGANGINAKPTPEVKYGPGIAAGNIVVDDEDYPVIQIFDPEQFQRENPCEIKHRRLVRSDRNAYFDSDQKPNAKVRDELNEILAYGPTQELTTSEKEVLWLFRRHLSKDKRALTKVVKATDWNSPNEVKQMTELIPNWAEIAIDSALELLGPTFDNPVVRGYAVDRLRKAGDEELQLYLLQLVQALKFESYEGEGEGFPSSSLAKFLIDRAVQNFRLGNYLHWFLMVECDDRGADTNAANRKLFARVEFHFMLELDKHNSEQRKILRRQGEMMAVLSKISKDIRFGRDSRPDKIEKLKKFLADPKNELLKIEPPLPLPLDPSILVSGIFPENSNVFKSSLSPLLLHFKIASSSSDDSTSAPTSPARSPKIKDHPTYSIIFKTGDDLRQDQLVIQIITLMDKLLLRENLDLKLTPYRILATSPKAGAVQFIASTPISVVSSTYKGSVLSFLKVNNADPLGPLGIRKDIMDTYIRSCAGYCVITYILGVGDRHLDNLLLSPTGNFFHIDFGFILGRDPKPFAPLIKLCKEMVEGLGGTTSPQYAQFKQYCFTAFTTLRKSSPLVLNLFSLMVQSSVQDIRLIEEQLGGLGGAVGKVRERFHLDVSEEEAVRLLDQVLADSVNAVFGVVIDRLHELVQNWRT